MRKRWHTASVAVDLPRPPGSEPQPVDLVDAISWAMAAHDPLDPWLVVGNYDREYWREEAAAAAPLVRLATSLDEVYVALVHVLAATVRSSGTDTYAEGQIRSAAEDVWRWLRLSSKS